MHIIKKLETFNNPFVSFVCLTTDSGKQGWGQMSTYNADITTTIFHRQIAPWALGYSLKNHNDIATLIAKIESREHKFPGSYRCRALAGLDTALWDLFGKLEQKPVVELLGGKVKKLRVYASSMRRDITPKEEKNRLMKLKDDFGFNAFKWRVGAECGQDIDEWPGRTETIVPLLAKSLGDDVAKLVDANSGFSVKRAIEVGKMLENEGINHYEEPCPYWQLEQTQQVTKALNIDITGGEQDWDLNIWQQMINKRVVDIVQPDVMYMGGLSRCLQVAQMANEMAMPCTPHSANLSLVTICTMHLLGAIDNAGKYLEFSIEGHDYYPWQENIFLGNPFKISAGTVAIPSEPGWGVSINPRWLKKAAYQISEQ